MKGKLAGKVVDRAVEAEKKKLKKKAKKRLCKVFLQILWTFFVLSVGLLAGIHWRVISAWIGKGEMPEIPEGHCH